MLDNIDRLPIGALSVLQGLVQERRVNAPFCAQSSLSSSSSIS